MEKESLFDGDTTVPNDTDNDPQEAGGAVEAATLRLAAAQTSLEAAEEQVRTAQEKSDQDLSGWLRAAASEALTQNQRARDRAVVDVEDAAEELAQVEADAAPEQVGAASSASQPEAQTPLVYQTEEEFMHGFLLPLYVRIVDSRNGRWCSEWYRHAEAVSRVEALWRAWEHLRMDGTTGMSIWWKDHADVHMAVLLSQKGPFHRCDTDRHRAPEPLPSKRGPGVWFPKASQTPDP